MNFKMALLEAVETGCTPLTPHTPSLPTPPHLSGERSSESVVEREEAMFAYHTNGGPHKPLDHLLLSLQVNLKNV